MEEGHVAPYFCNASDKNQSGSGGGVVTSTSSGSLEATPQPNGLGHTRIRPSSKIMNDMKDHGVFGSRSHHSSSAATSISLNRSRRSDAVTTIFASTNVSLVECGVQCEPRRRQAPHPARSYDFFLLRAVRGRAARAAATTVSILRLRIAWRYSLRVVLGCE